MALEFLTQKVFGVPLWIPAAVGGIGLAIFAPKLFNIFGGGKDKTSGGLGNTAGSATTPTDPNIDPTTNVPWSVENMIDPNTGYPLWYTLFGNQKGPASTPPGAPGPYEQAIPPQYLGPPGAGPPPGQPPQPGNLSSYPNPSSIYGQPGAGSTTAPPPPQSQPIARTGTKPSGLVGPPTRRGGGPGSENEAPARYLAPSGWPSAETSLITFAQAHGMSVSHLQALNPWILEKRGSWDRLYTSDMIRVA